MKVRSGENAVKLGHMLTLPRSNDSLLVRTDFTNDDAWQEIADAAQRENEDGFRAYIQPVSDPGFEGVSWESVRTAIPPNDQGAAVLFVADRTTLTSPDHPILVVDLLGDRGRPPFRCIPSELWGVDNNLNIANMDWEEFASATDEGGVFRGFGE